MLVAITIIILVILRKKKRKGVNKKVKSERMEEEYKNMTDKRPADVAFIENIDKFIPLLDGLERNEIDTEKWKIAIIDVNNKDLFQLWCSAISSGNLVQKWLEVFLEPVGLKYENCISFIAMKRHVEEYDTQDGASLVLGEHYKVLSPCWLLTRPDEDGNDRTTIIRKGIVIKHNE